MSASPPRRPVLPQRQIGQHDCGFVCLSIVLEALGSPVPPAELVKLGGGMGGPVAASTLVRLAELLGFTAKGYFGGTSDLKRLLMPGILHWKDGHFVVFDRYDNGRFLIANPSVGYLLWYTESEVTQAFSGTIIVVY
ncbi:cysteine peptidase family C39 domain-containing protein [Gemmatimonas sp.]|jgi:ATP-binding cassette subfamily B protein|uniref:cysteine peptidase family C39 domain-containing protein n=1 Tax=Gemmatimonas sp. TaxID=1962908 RepID=UPI0037BE7671